MNPQYAILRFAKYKEPEISRIEAHNERTKEQYASNPDIDTSRTRKNFHLVMPKRKYRAEAERQIAEAGCRARSDSVRVVEALITASPDFFKGKKRSEVKVFFEEALTFMKKQQSEETIISAVVHMDEKTPHMHLCFVPLTEDKRLCAKEIVGNRKKLTEWQDAYWKHMVRKYPDLERGETASKTGQTHIPLRLYKEAVRLGRMREQIMQIMSDTNILNKRANEVKMEALLNEYIPGAESMYTRLKKYEKTYRELVNEKRKLGKELDASKVGILEQMKLLGEIEELRRTVGMIPPEVLAAYRGNSASLGIEREK